MKIYNGFISILVNFLIILILVVSLLILLSSHIEIMNVGNGLLIIGENIEKEVKALKNDKKLKTNEDLKSYLSEMESKYKNVLETNTISFFFQLFSVSLLSIGAYLFFTYKKFLEDMQFMYKNELMPLATNNILYIKLTDAITHSYLIASSKRKDQIVELRDLIRKIHGYMKYASQFKDEMFDLDHLVDKIVIIETFLCDELEDAEMKLQCQECIQSMRKVKKK